MDWRQDIIGQLEKREAIQNVAFSELFTNLSLASKNWRKCEERMVSLDSENAQLKLQNTDLQRSLEKFGSGKGGVPVNQREMDELKNKLNSANEQMLDLLSKQNSVNQKLVDINEQLRTKEEEMKRLKENEMKLYEKISQHEKQIKDQAELLQHRDITTQVLQDELQALQLELLSREERTKELERENKSLLERWLQKMNDEASKMNQAIEQFESNQRTTIIAEATKIKINDQEPDGLLDRNTVIAVLPTKAKKKIIAHESEINCIQSSHSGKFFATGSSDRKIKIFEAGTGNVKHTIRGSQQGVMCVQFSQNDELILGASNDNTTRIWSIETGRTKHTLTGHIHKVYTAKFSWDSSKAISGSYDRTIKVWDLNRGFCLRTIFSYSSVNDLCLTDDSGNHVISGHLDNHIRFWDTKTGELVNEITEIHSGQVTSVSLSPDGTKILTNSRDNTLKLIDLNMFQVISTYSAENFKTGTNWSKACFSPDGQFVAAGGNDGSVYIWNALTTKVEKILKEHNGSVNAVSWSPMGDYLFSADKDKNVVVWEP